MRKFRVIETRVYFVDAETGEDALDRFYAMSDENIAVLCEDVDSYLLEAETLDN